MLVGLVIWGRLPAMPKLLFIGLSFFLLQTEPTFSQGPTGLIKGTVRDSLTGETIPFANIPVEGTKLGASAG